MTLYAVLAWIAAGFGLALSLSSLLRRKRTIVQWCFLAGMGLLALESLFAGFSFQALTPQKIVHWQVLRLLVMSFIPGVWLLFTLSYSRGNYAEFLKRWRPVWMGALFAPPLLALALMKSLVISATEGEAPYQWYLRLGTGGIWLHILFLLVAVLILMNLERTFRASVGTMRWRVKYMVLGLILLFGVRIYTSSQFLLYSSINLWLSALDPVALLMAMSLMMVSLFRVGLYSHEVYPSQSLLQYSLTGLLVGVYLLSVGFLAKLVQAIGGDRSFPLAAFLVMLGLVGLTVVLLSERLRQKGRQFVSRHLRRPQFDYRRTWMTFTERTSSASNREQFCRVVVKWVSEAFNVLSVNVWFLDDSRNQFILGASTSLPQTKSGDCVNLDPDTETFIKALREKPDPIELDKTQAPWKKSLEQYNPQFFPIGTERICVPLVAGDTFLGLMTLADRVANTLFSTEDLDLLKCVGDQVAASLLNFQLSDRLGQIREMEAFQLMSAFFVHDLKNTASTLNLMLKNMPEHFDDPAFRQDALRGLGKSVTRINDLIGRLGLIRESIQLNQKPSDLNETIRAALAAHGDLPKIKVTQSLAELPSILIDPNQIRKVLSNLIINAVEAMNGSGEISITTELRLQWIVCTVADQGCGMTPDFMARSLFRPFQTTKKKGIGIGMFLSKRIIEAHGGKLEVESMLGKGTTFRILLPQNKS